MGGMGKIAAMIAVVAAAIGGASDALAQDAAGDWHGTLHSPGLNTDLRLGLSVKAKAGGGYEGTISSPDQGAADIPLDEVKVDAGTLSFSLAAIMASYKGQWDEARKAWVGQFTQGGSVPLVLTAGKP